MRFIVLATETTGLYPKNKDRIVEIAAIEVSHGQIQSDRCFHYYLDPECHIPNMVVRIHGIDDKKVKGCPKFIDVADEFLEFIKGATLVIHNATFDLAFISNELALAGLADINNMNVIDSLELARQKYPSMRNSLSVLCHRFDICRKKGDLDSALLDVYLLADVYLEMTKDDPKVGILKKVRDFIVRCEVNHDQPITEENVTVIQQQSINTLVAKVYQNLQDIYDGKITQGILTGFTDLDEFTNGLQKGQLIVIGGRPSMGKSAFAMNIVSNIALRNKAKPSIAVFSLEHDTQRWLKMLMSAEANVEAGRLRTGKFTSTDWRNLASTSGKLAESNIYLNDSHSGRSIKQVANQCRMLKEMDANLSLIVIDHIQLIDNDNMALKKIPHALKSLAIDLGVPIIVLSQLDRKLENRADKRPMLGDIKTFTELEREADLIMFLYREEVYHCKPSNKEGVEVIIAKHQNGTIGTISLRFLKDYCRFENI